jgi:hypothetical protein
MIEVPVFSAHGFLRRADGDSCRQRPFEASSEPKLEGAVSIANEAVYAVPVPLESAEPWIVVRLSKSLDRFLARGTKVEGIPAGSPCS